MRGHPPLDSGGCHDKVILSSVVAAHSSGPPGADGLSVKKNQYYIDSIQPYLTDTYGSNYQSNCNSIYFG